MSAIKVLAIDASMNRTGWCVIHGDPDVPESYWVDTANFWAYTATWPRARKLSSLRLRAETLARGEKPSIIAVEGMGGVDRSPLRRLETIGALERARAMIEQAAWSLSIPYVEIEAGLIKASLCVTASGRPNRVAKKPEVHQALSNLRLYAGDDPDIGDAVAVGYACLRRICSGDIKL